MRLCPEKNFVTDGDFTPRPKLSKLVDLMDVSFNHGSEINAYGTKFNIFSFLSETISMKIYECTECCKLFTSWTSFENHSHHVTLKYDPQLAHALLYTFVSVYDISWNAISYRWEMIEDLIIYWK